MKYLLVFILLVYSNSALARQVTVTDAGSSARNSPGEYSLEDSRAEISSNSLTITGSGTPVQINAVRTTAISPQAKLLGLLRAGDMLQLQVYDSEGRQIRNRPLDYYDPDDQSLEIKQFDDGRTIIRDNIANFTFFESDGTQVYNISNSTQSEAGETISEMESDAFGRTVVLYNPRINYGNEIGSRARIIHDQSGTTTLTESRQRTITDVSVTESGNFITLVSTSGESDDEVYIFDRFGNELGRLASDEELTGAVSTEDGEYVTIFSQFRVLVYRISSGDRIGSSSLQAQVITAAYQPDENQIIVMTGDVANPGRVSDGRIYAIDIGARSLGNDNITGTLTFLDPDNIKIERTATSRFHVTGFNRLLEVQTSF